MLTRSRHAAPKISALLLALAGLGACSADEDRSADAAVLAEQFDAAWMPTDAQLWESLTPADPCRVDCPPVAVSFTYLCPCDDIDAEMAEVQERVRSSGFEIVEPYSSESGFFEGRMAVSGLPSGMVQLRGYAIADARDVEPLNTALAAEADGRGAINISLVADDASDGRSGSDSAELQG